jgi:hypothetical protein
MPRCWRRVGTRRHGRQGAGSGRAGDCMAFMPAARPQTKNALASQTIHWLCAVAVKSLADPQPCHVPVLSPAVRHPALRTASPQPPTPQPPTPRSCSLVDTRKPPSKPPVHIASAPSAPVACRSAAAPRQTAGRPPTGAPRRRARSGGARPAVRARGALSHEDAEGRGPLRPGLCRARRGWCGTRPRDLPHRATGATSQTRQPPGQTRTYPPAGNTRCRAHLMRFGSWLRARAWSLQVMRRMEPPEEASRVMASEMASMTHVSASSRVMSSLRQHTVWRRTHRACLQQRLTRGGSLASGRRAGPAQLLT